jgi:DNA-binding transcriptional LysR family regulator
LQKRNYQGRHPSRSGSHTGLEAIDATLQKRNARRVPPSADNIATFVTVVRQKTLSAAARSLGVPKSTVSRRLLRLEQELDSKLLHRDPRKVTLTPAGRSFYESVAFAIDSLDAAVAALDRSSHEPRGAIRLTAPTDLGRMVLAPMLVAFLARYPDITLDLVFTNRLVDLIEEGIDLAVRAGRVLQGGLFARKLCDSELQLAASPKLAAALHGADVRELSRQPFVLHGAGPSEHAIELERRGGKRTVELTVKGRVHVDDYATLAELVARGQGLGLLPALHVAAGVEAGRLVRVFPEWSARTANVVLVYASRQLPERVRLLSEFLQESFAAQHTV